MKAYNNKKFMLQIDDVECEKNLPSAEYDEHEKERASY